MKPKAVLLMSLVALLCSGCTQHAPPASASASASGALTDRELVDLRTRVLLLLITGQHLPGRAPGRPFARGEYAIGFNPQDSQSVRDQVLSGLKTAEGTQPAWTVLGADPTGTNALCADLYQVEGDTIRMTGCVTGRGGPLSGIMYVLEFSREPGGFRFNGVSAILAS